MTFRRRLGVLPLVPFAELGFAVAYGVLLDTLIVRSLLVPALVYELDDKVWRPVGLRRVPPEVAAKAPGAVMAPGASGGLG